jgi:hypothetical protein
VIEARLERGAEPAENGAGAVGQDEIHGLLGNRNPKEGVGADEVRDGRRAPYCL